MWGMRSSESKTDEWICRSQPGSRVSWSWDRTELTTGGEGQEVRYLKSRSGN